MHGTITSLARPTLCAVLALAATAGIARAEVVEIVAGRDATLIEDPEGDLANGAGPVLFVGLTNQPESARRRALLWFDVAASVPRTAIVTGVTLTIHVAPSNAVEIACGVHRVLEPWSEGPSSATGGGGAAAEPGDSTWLHRHYDDLTWRAPGGDFIPRSDAVVTVGGEGFYAWAASERLAADVRLWLKAPERNFGWLLVSDELVPQSVKRIDSREAGDAALQPVLTVEYELPAAR